MQRTTDEWMHAGVFQVNAQQKRRFRYTDLQAGSTQDESKI